MTHLKIGDKAPHFSAIDQDQNTHTLDQYKNQKLILFFYPKANTPGCTTQACNLRDHFPKLQSQNYHLLGISADTVNNQKKFATKQNLPYPLLANENLDMIKNYGVWGPKKFMGREYEGIHRTTFIINQNGIIENIITKVKTKEHAQQILETTK